MDDHIKTFRAEWFQTVQELAKQVHSPERRKKRKEDEDAVETMSPWPQKNMGMNGRMGGKG